MVPFLKLYRRRHSGVEIRLTEDGGLRLPMRLERGDVHLATIPEADGRFDSRLLFPTHAFVKELVTYTRANYPNRDLTRRAPSMPRPKEST
jgi:DNA-binding transcriptional LysR family regulator